MLNANSREVLLWRAVLQQTVMDATMQATNRYDLKVKAFAQEWLLTNSEGFRQLCRRACVVADDVIVKAEALKRRGWPSPPRRKYDQRGLIKDYALDSSSPIAMEMGDGCSWKQALIYEDNGSLVGDW